MTVNLYSAANEFPIIPVNGRQATWVIENPQLESWNISSPMKIGTQILHK